MTGIEIDLFQIQMEAISRYIHTEFVVTDLSLFWSPAPSIRQGGSGRDSPSAALTRKRGGDTVPRRRHGTDGPGRAASGRDLRR